MPLLLPPLTLSILTTPVIGCMDSLYGVLYEAACRLLPVLVVEVLLGLLDKGLGRDSCLLRKKKRGACSIFKVLYWFATLAGGSPARLNGGGLCSRDGLMNMRLDF